MQFQVSPSRPIRVPAISGQALPTLCAVLLFASSAASAQADSLTLSRTLSEREQAAATSYWTRERIAAAPPLKPLVDRGVERLDVSALGDEADPGPEEREPPGLPDLDAVRIARAAYAQDWEALELGPKLDPAVLSADLPKGTSDTYTSYDVNTNLALWQILPHTWFGKLNFTTATGGSSCSATAISGNNIVTAAHCVYDTTNNVFYNNWAFSPAFRNGSTPYGTFTARVCTILTAWTNLTGSFNINSWSRNDVAVCSMNANSAGQTLNAAVGYAGRMWNAGNTQLVFVNGYPGRTYTDALVGNGTAQYLRSCTAETFQRTTDTLGAGCNWGRGTSGGAWFVGYKPFVLAGWVNSVYSGFVLNQQNAYGARFTSNNILALCNVRGC